MPVIVAGHCQRADCRGTLLLDPEGLEPGGPDTYVCSLCGRGPVRSAPVVVLRADGRRAREGGHYGAGLGHS